MWLRRSAKAREESDSTRVVSGWWFATAPLLAYGMVGNRFYGLAPFDNHVTFHFAEVFSMCGETEPTLDVLEAAVNKGFCPAGFIETHCRFLESLWSHTRFAPIVATARARSDMIRRDATERST